MRWRLELVLKLSLIPNEYNTCKTVQTRKHDGVSQREMSRSALMKASSLRQGSVTFGQLGGFQHKRPPPAQKQRTLYNT
jgi:hypothetical protein